MAKKSSGGDDGKGNTSVSCLARASAKTARTMMRYSQSFYSANSDDEVPIPFG